MLLLLAPPTGTDLSANTGRALFFADHGLRPVDFSWYGGVGQFGYSLVSQAVMSIVGVRLTGVLAAVLSAVALGLLLERAGARRPRLAALVGALGLVGNVVSGRVTYGLGLALGLLGLLALQRGRASTAAVLTLVAGATSPVAGLFLGLCGTALLLTGHRRAGWTLGVGAAVPLVVLGLVFGQGGSNTMSVRDLLTGLLLCALVVAAVPRRVVRLGAGLAGLGLALAWALPTPVGLNMTRLTAVFALPLVLAWAPWRPRTVAVAVALLLAPQRPVLLTDLGGADDPLTTASAYAPLVAQLERRVAGGRVEVVPTANYWESVHVAHAVPLARGWLRQQDTARNPLFFDGSLSAETYRVWLVDNGVGQVALHDAEPSWVGRREADLVRSGLPYLTQVWSGGGWTLYDVAGRPTLADGATVLGTDATGVVLRVDRPGEVRVRVQYSRWLTVDGPGCLVPDGRWTTLRAEESGTYRIDSHLRPASGDSC